MAFFEKLDALAREHRSLLCVGLDPHPGDLPNPDATAARDFCLRLIKPTKTLIWTLRFYKLSGML